LTNFTIVSFLSAKSKIDNWIHTMLIVETTVGNSTVFWGFNYEPFMKH